VHCQLHFNDDDADMYLRMRRFSRAVHT